MSINLMSNWDSVNRVSGEIKLSRAHGYARTIATDDCFPLDSPVASHQRLLSDCRPWADGTDGKGDDLSTSEKVFKFFLSYNDLFSSTWFCPSPSLSSFCSPSSRYFSGYFNVRSARPRYARGHNSDVLIWLWWKLIIHELFSFIVGASETKI